MMTPAPGRTRGYFGLFSLAATIYTVGVGTFAGWSYLQQRHNLLAQVDQSLVQATHAAEQILGDVFIMEAVTTDAPFDSGHANSRTHLNDFAEDCGFGILGSIAYKNGEQRELIVGSPDHHTDPEHAARFNDLVSMNLPVLITNITHQEDNSTLMHTAHLPPDGEIRLAIRYTALSDDAGYAMFAARSMEDVKVLLHTLSIRSVGIGIFLYVMAFPLIVLYNIVQRKTARESAEYQELLQKDYTLLKEREAELEDAIHDLERFNTVAIGRESRIIELKAEVNTLLEQLKQQKRYNIDHVE